MIERHCNCTIECRVVPSQRFATVTGNNEKEIEKRKKKKEKRKRRKEKDQNRDS